MQGACGRERDGPPCAALTDCSWRLCLVLLLSWLLGAGVSLKIAYLYAMVFSCRCEPSASSVPPDAFGPPPTGENSALTHCHLRRPGPDHDVVYRASRRDEPLGIHLGAVAAPGSRFESSAVARLLSHVYSRLTAASHAAAAAVQVYNTILKVVFLSTSYATIYLIRNQYKHTYDKENDTFRMIFLVVPCFVLACFINYYPNPQEVRKASFGW